MKYVHLLDMQFFEKKIWFKLVFKMSSKHLNPFEAFLMFTGKFVISVS